jgi:hypothetical protein
VLILALTEIGLTRLIAYFILAGNIWPLLESPGSISADIYYLQHEVDSLKNRPSEFAEAARLLPDKMERETANREILSLARESGVEVVHFAFTSQDGEPVWRLIDDRYQAECRLGLRGDYDSLAAFLNQVDGSNPQAKTGLLAVEELLLLPESTGKMTAEIRLFFFANYSREIELSIDAQNEQLAIFRDTVSKRAFKYRPDDNNLFVDPSLVRVSEEEEQSDAGQDVAATNPTTPGDTQETSEITLEDPVSSKAEISTAGSGLAEGSNSREEIALMARLKLLDINGIAWSPKNPRIFIGDGVYREGQDVALPGDGGTALIVEIKPGEVVFSVGGKRVSQHVKMFAD